MGLLPLGEGLGGQGELGELGELVDLVLGGSGTMRNRLHRLIETT